MSSYPPPPLRTPVGGKCDANGNLTVTSIVPSRTFYSVFTAILKVTAGAPQWELDLLNMPVGVGGGGTVVMGAVYSDPGDSFTLLVKGAAPNAVVSGALYGFLSDAPETLPQLGITGGGGLGGTSGALPGGQYIVKGTIPNVNDTLAIPCGGSSTVGIQLLDTVAVGSLFHTEGTVDDATWSLIGCQFGNSWVATGGSFPDSGTWTTQTLVTVPCAGLSQVRIKRDAVAGQTSTVLLRATPAAALGVPVAQQLAIHSVPVVIANDQSAIFRAPKDSGRAQIMLSWEEMAGTAATESALTNFTFGSKAGVALAATNQYTVTAAKTLRIQSVTLYLKSTSTAELLARYRIRQAASVANNSPVIFDAVMALDAATVAATQGDQLAVPIPDGLEVAAGQQITFTWFTSANTCTVGMSITGFEY